mgnify:CR=1 FL=1
MKYLRISNKGIINVEALTLLGASTKRGLNGKIGMFGSGNKYALAFLLRNGFEVSIYAGNEKIEIGTEKAQFRDNDFEVITISMDRTADDAKLWFEENDISALTPWHDASYSISGKLRLPGLPTSILYDVYGREIARLPGEADWNSTEVKSLISYLVEEN